MFRAWQADLKPLLRPGANQLCVVFPPPDKAAHERASHDKWQPILKAPEKTSIRRAAYEYGWDWGPTFVTSGIWRPASLSLWNNARIDDLHIAQIDIKPRVARINAEVAVTSAIDTDASLVLSYTQDGRKITTTRAITLHHGDNTITESLSRSLIPPSGIPPATARSPSTSSRPSCASEPASKTSGPRAQASAPSSSSAHATAGDGHFPWL